MKGSSLDTSSFHFAAGPLQQFNDTVLRGNQGCSPHAPADYMSIGSMVSSLPEEPLMTCHAAGSDLRPIHRHLMSI